MTKDEKAKYDAIYRAKNKERILERDRAYSKKNREKIRLKRAEYFAKNREKVLSSNAEWHKENKEKVAAGIAAWHKAHPEIKAAKIARRRASKLTATPTWANDFFMKEAYRLSRARTLATGIPWHVDHIVPLRSKIVCGLHCEQNMQVIVGRSNISKGNRSWPDMPI